MFFEFVTKKKEPVSLNLLHILFITPDKNGAAVIFDTFGMEYRTNEPYEEVKTRLNQLQNS